jgi:SAM-dependent methyltransferase
MANYQELDPVKFYDKISSKYEFTLDSIPENSHIRNEVRKYFLKNVSGKFVLDFGGGTGEDLLWLAEKGFNVYFCEPSSGMRKIAIDKLRRIKLEAEIVFLNEINANFHKWNKSDHPFKNKVDGILANFAVFNSIKDLEKLSAKLALITDKNCKLIILVLDVNVKRFFSRNLPVSIKLFLNGYGLATEIKDGNNRMVVYLHTGSNIIKSFRKYFDYIENFRVQKSTFRVFYFIRNEKEVV